MASERLATRGYAVLLADSRTHIGTSSRDLVASVVPGVQEAIRAGIADPKRIGIMGESYGGYSTLAIITQTALFRAAVMEWGYGDQVGLYGAMTDDGTAIAMAILEDGVAAMKGTPWKYPQRYLVNSPILVLDRVTTPLLIVHGRDDPIVPFNMGREVFVDLRRLGREAEYAEYSGEGHWFTRYEDNVDLSYRILRWFDAHLKPTE